MSYFQQQARASINALDAEQAAFDEEHIASLREDLDSAWKSYMLASEAHIKAYRIFREAERDLEIGRRKGGN